MAFIYPLPRPCSFFLFFSFFLLACLFSDVGGAGLGLGVLRRRRVHGPARHDPGLPHRPGRLSRTRDLRRGVLLVLGPHAQQVSAAVVSTGWRVESAVSGRLGCLVSTIEQLSSCMLCCRARWRGGGQFEGLAASTRLRIAAVAIDVVVAVD